MSEEVRSVVDNCAWPDWTDYRGPFLVNKGTGYKVSVVPERVARELEERAVKAERELEALKARIERTAAKHQHRHDNRGENAVAVFRSTELGIAREFRSLLSPVEQEAR